MQKRTLKKLAKPQQFKQGAPKNASAGMHGIPSSIFWGGERPRPTASKPLKEDCERQGSGKRRGSALLTTLLIMSVLMILTLGLSRLLIGDIRNTADIVDSGKAYYVAEAGIENALYELHQNISGYETPKEGKTLKFANDLTSTYHIANKSSVFPYRDPAENDLPAKAKIDPGFFYQDLKLNDSITIPLFVIEDGKVKNIKDFRVEYYVGYKGALDGVNWSGIGNKDVDVLRWKIFGLNEGKTESLSDYFPVFPSTDASNPMCMGTTTAINSESLPSSAYLKTNCATQNFIDADKAREYYKNVKNVGTVYYSASQYQKEAEALKGKTSRPETLSQIHPSSLPVVEGAETTSIDTSDLLNQNTDQATFIPNENYPHGYPISTFLEEHKNNFITLTNIINPTIINASDPNTREEIATIKYRLVVFPEGDDERSTVREYAAISSDGFYKDIKQTIEAKIRLDQFLPVFNFSLYRTSVDKPVKR